MATVSSSYLLTLVKQLQSAKVSDDVINACLAMDIDELVQCTSTKQPMPIERYNQLYQLYLQQMSATHFGFSAQTGENPGRYHMLLLLMVNSDTLKSALDKLHDFYQTFATSEQLIRYNTGKPGLVSCELTVLMQEKYRHSHQQTIIAANLAAGFHRILCWLTASSLAMKEVHLEGIEPVDKIKYRGLFNCPVSFAKPGTRLVYPEQVLELGIIQTEATLDDFLATYPGGLFLAPTQDSQGLIHKIRSLVFNRLQQGIASADQISQMLNLSTARMQAQLKKEHTSYHKLVEDVRRKEARALIAHSDMPIKHIASRLGFTASSAFHRSFKRWTGQTPAHYRRNARTRNDA